MVRTPMEDIERELRDPEFAKLFGAVSAKSEFAIVLAKARDRAGVTQKELADRLGVSQAYIAKLSAGDANPTLGAVGRMLAALGFSLVMDVEPLLSCQKAPTRASSEKRQQRIRSERDLECSPITYPRDRTS